MSVYIDEALPVDPIEAQAVLLARRHHRARVRDGVQVAEALAFLFGHDADEASRFEEAAKAPSPLEAAAATVATNGIATLGHDADHVERCRFFLLERKKGMPAFDGILALDLGTLLAVAQAAELARADDMTGKPPLPILILGETGTGKELLAQAIVNHSRRGGRPYEKISVAGVGKSLIASALFGHQRGAFTGADKDRTGHVRRANKGTLLLDEVGDLPMSAQLQLLRFLETGEFHRLGDDAVHRSDVRVIAATWQDLDRLMKKRRFRRDLYHRICTGVVRLPPLVERKTGFDTLVTEMLRGVREGQTVGRAARDALRMHDWPGNLRELHSTIRLASVRAGDRIRLEDLPWKIQSSFLARPVEERAAAFLGDEEPSPQLSLTRANVVTHAITATSESPRLSRQERQLLEVMEMFPDPTGEHRLAVQQVREVVELAHRANHTRSISNRLATAATVPGAMPEEFREALHNRSVAHKEAAARTQATADELYQALPSTSPWIRIYMEAQNHPFFRLDDGTALTQVMFMAAQFLTMAQPLAPEFVEHLREIARQGGLRGLVDRTKQLMLDSLDDEKPEVENVFEVPAGSHRQWDTEAWTRVVEQYNTRQELARDLDISGTTLKKYLDAAGVTPHWARRT
mgnify:CR=1 FL=1